MDAGDYTGSQQVLRSARMSSMVAFAPMQHHDDVMAEMSSLGEYEAEMLNPSAAKMTRKRLSYDIFSRRRSQKS